MDKKFRLFNLKEIVDEIKKNIDREYKDVANYDLKDDMTFMERKNLREYKTIRKRLDSITDDSEIENLSFYEDYLSKFSIESLLQNYQLKINPDNRATHADYDILLRLIFADSRSSYNLTLDKESNHVVVNFTAGYLTTSLDQLRTFHYKDVFCTFLEEHFKKEAFRMIYENNEKEENQRIKRLLAFVQNVELLKNQNDILDVLNQLKALQNS